MLFVQGRLCNIVVNKKIATDFSEVKHFAALKRGGAIIRRGAICGGMWY